MKIFNKRKNYSNEIDIYVAQLLFEYNTATDAESRNTIIARLKKHILENNFPHDPRLKCELGRFLYLEMISDKEEWIAITLFDQAAERRNIEAKHLLHLAIANHRKYAKKGVLISQSLLGRYLALKDSSSVEAGMWLKEAANKDDPESEHFLSTCYLSGLCGLKEDKVQAKYYAQRAVDHGNLEAAFNLGCFYADGIGCEKNIGKAEEYLKMAKDKGHPNAQKELDDLYSEEKTQSKPDTNLESLMALKREIKEMRKELQDLKQNSSENTARIIASNDSNRDKIIANTNEQSELTRITVISESKKVRKLVKAIPKKIKKLIFSKLDEVTRANAEFIKCFEQMHEQLEKGLSDIQWTVNETKYNIETLSSKMQDFFDKMEEECKTQAASPECSSLRDACINELSSLFGNYWTNGQLLESTKESLIAARVLLACAEHEKLDDCRGIVISATSALERELKARFYTGLIDYLNENENYSESDLPNILKPKNGQCDFTLGDVKYILWLGHFKKDEAYPNDPSKHIYDYTANHQEIVREYLKNCIISPDIVSGAYKYERQVYTDKNPEYVFTYRGSCYTQTVSEIVQEYRNPAAHSSDIDKEKEKKCCKTVIGTSRGNPKKAESCLLDLLKLTERFKHCE